MEFGQDPNGEEEIQLAEELAQIPEQYRLGGVLSPKEVARDLTLPDNEETLQEVQEARLQTRLRQEGPRRSSTQLENSGTAIPNNSSDALDQTAARLIQIEADRRELTKAEAAFLKNYREFMDDLSTFLDNRAKDAIYEMKMAARGFVFVNRRN